VIRFDDVSVTYRGGVRALRNVDLRIDDGEFVVVVGLSGAGKSTLLRALNGLVRATSGSITSTGPRWSVPAAQNCAPSDPGSG
jgi:phosphonate transport system ATP-binding protein